jgi:hypothetical protein
LKERQGQQAQGQGGDIQHEIDAGQHDGRKHDQDHQGTFQPGSKAAGQGVQGEDQHQTERQ